MRANFPSSVARMKLGFTLPSRRGKQPHTTTIGVLPLTRL